MEVSTYQKDVVEKRNIFYKTICELNKIDKRYRVVRDNDYFDNHTLQLVAFNFWDWLRNGHKKIATINYLSSSERVYINVTMPNTIKFCVTVGEFFEDNGLKAIVSDDTIRAKETC